MARGHYRVKIEVASIPHTPPHTQSLFVLFAPPLLLPLFAMAFCFLMLLLYTLLTFYA